MTNSKKVFFDVGTNLFQGYEFFKNHLNITDDWIKVFIEPNPNFNTPDNINKIQSIPNSVYLPFALCDDINSSVVDFYYIPNEAVHNMDQGGRIYNRCSKCVQIKVPTITIDSLVAPYLDCELYFKFDCEGAEYGSIPKLIEKYHNITKFVACEFHYLNQSNEKELISQMDAIKRNISGKNIQYMEWR
jgi:FkbM family methyltransferase